jgi:hypothetical protein
VGYVWSQQTPIYHCSAIINSIRIPARTIAIPVVMIVIATATKPIGRIAPSAHRDQQHGLIG